jgi:hypothetical protein
MDHVFPVPSDESGDHEPPAEVRELGDRSEAVIEDLLAIGVHIADRLVMVPLPDPDGDDDPAPRLMMQGFIGDVAFSDRVLRPQILDDDEVLADIEEATAAADYEAIRKRLLGDNDG